MTDQAQPKPDRELAELRQREKLYRTLYNNTPVMMHSANAEGKLANVNDFWLDTLGYVYVEVIGRKLFDFLAPASRPHAKTAILEQFVRDSYLRDVPLQLRKKDGALIDVLLSAVDQRDEAGRVVSAFFFMVDVTERRRSEEIVAINLALQRLRNEILAMEGEAGWEKIVAATNEELRALIDFNTCGIQLIDLEGDSFVAYGMEPSQELYKYEIAPIPKSLLQTIETGSTLYRRTRKEIETTDDKINPEIRSIVDAPFAGGTIAINSKEENAFSDRDIQILEEFAQVLSTAHRRFQDLMALTRKEEQLRQAQKMEAVGQLTSGIAHNFNNMLAGVALNLEIVLAKAPEEFHPALADALTSSQQASAMIRQLMVFARSDSAAHFKRVEFAPIVERAVEICRQTFDRKIEIRLDCPDAMPPLEGDAIQLEQVLLNLCINARDALEGVADRPQTLRVNVSFRHFAAAELTGHPHADPGSYLRIAVEDTGIGMDAATQRRIFEPFFTTKEADKGTGLGLATAYAIVQEHRGWIECQSAVGAGTTFAVYLPLLESKIAPRPRPESTTAIEGGSETVLIIEDEDIVRNALSGILELHGYTILEGADGIEGLEIYEREEETIDLVVLDLSMPRMSGDEVLERLRADNPQVKVILCTGFMGDEEAIQTADAILVKPIRQDKLIRTVRQVLDAPG